MGCIDLMCNLYKGWFQFILCIPFQFILKQKNVQMNTGIFKPVNRSVWTKVGRLSWGNRSYSIRSGLDFALGCFVLGFVMGFGLDLRFGIYNIKIYLNKPLIFWVMGFKGQSHLVYGYLYISNSFINQSLPR